MDPPGVAKPDCLIAAEIAKDLNNFYSAENSSQMINRFSGFDWKTEEDAFNDGFRMAHANEMDSQGGATSQLATCKIVHNAGTNGVQLPIKEYASGKLVGTEMLYMSSKFDINALFQPSPWSGLPAVVVAEKKDYSFWISNGRTNNIWKTASHDQYLSLHKGRFPMVSLEINPVDAKKLGIKAGDIV